MRMIILQIVSDQIQCTPIVIMMTHRVIRQVQQANNRLLTLWNIKRDDPERILRLNRFMLSKVCSNRLIILMASWERNWVWIWAYRKQESKSGFKIDERNRENRKLDQEMIKLSIDHAPKIILTDPGYVLNPVNRLVNRLVNRPRWWTEINRDLFRSGQV